jgi:hypothetical protein
MDRFKAHGNEKSVRTLDAQSVRITFHIDLSPKQRDGLYYLYRIMHALFPENVPDAIGRGKEYIVLGRHYLDIQRMPLDAYHVATMQKRGFMTGSSGGDNAHEVQYYERRAQGQGRAEYDNFVEHLRRAGLGFVVDNTYYVGNYSQHEGGFRYLDLRSPIYGTNWPLYDAQLLQNAIEAIADEAWRKRAQKDFDSLVALSR